MGGGHDRLCFQAGNHHRGGTCQSLECLEAPTWERDTCQTHSVPLLESSFRKCTCILGIKGLSRIVIKNNIRNRGGGHAGP